MYVMSLDPQMDKRSMENNKIVITPKPISHGNYILNQCFLILQLTIDRISTEDLSEGEQKIINLFKSLKEKFINNDNINIRRKIETFLWWMNFGSDILLQTLIKYADEICAQYVIQNLNGKVRQILTYKTDIFQNDFEVILMDELVMLFYNPIIFESIFSQTVFFINTYSEALGVNTFYNNIPTSRLNFRDSNDDKKELNKMVNSEIQNFRDKIKSNIYNGIDLNSKESLLLIQKDITNEIRIKLTETCRNSLNNNLNNENLLHSFNSNETQENIQHSISNSLKAVYGKNCLSFKDHNNTKNMTINSDPLDALETPPNIQTENEIYQYKTDDGIGDKFDDSFMNDLDEEYRMYNYSDNPNGNQNFFKNINIKTNTIDYTTLFEYLYKKSKWNKDIHEKLIKLTQKLEMDANNNEEPLKQELTNLIIEILDKFQKTYNFTIVCQFLLQCDRVLDNVYNLVFKSPKLNLRTIKNHYKSVSLDFSITNK